MIRPKVAAVRNLLNYAHHCFRNFLQHKAAENGRTGLMVNEAYTLKTLSWAGEIIHNLGGCKAVQSSEGQRMDRDNNGARGLSFVVWETPHSSEGV